MSTDVVSTMDLLLRARRDLQHEQAMRMQAEDRVRELEDTARRAEERAEELRNDRDGWSNFAHDLANEHLINQYAHDRLNNRRAITELLYEIWSTGTPIDDLGVAAVVQDYNEAIR
jgi:hypothetical protein